MNSDAQLSVTIVADRDTLREAYAALCTVAAILERRARDHSFSDTDRDAYALRARQCRVAANQITPIGIKPDATKPFQSDVFGESQRAS